jgi:hypothetical protein
VKGALGAIVGGVAVGGAQKLASHSRRPKGVMGITLPGELHPRHLDPKRLTNNIDLKDVLRRIGDAAEQIEARSEDVRNLSHQAKRLTRKLT